MSSIALRGCSIGAIAVALSIATSAAAAPKRRVATVASRPPRPQPAPVFTPVSPEEDREPGGIFGPLRIGPLVGAAFPRTMSFELFMKVRRAVGVGLEYSLTPTVTIDSVTVHASAIAGDLRWFVLDSPFFLGAGVGVQSLQATASVGPYSANADTKKVFVTPRLGVLWTFGAGFSVGADAGIEVPIAHDETIVPAIPQVANNDVLVALTRRPLPDVHIVRLGWLF
jgi:outer membrane receptor protein involved in Fe transport